MELSQQFATIAPRQQEHLARSYEAAPAFDRQAVPAYRAMAEETKRQFGDLQQRGIQVGVTRSDPYTGPRGLFTDIAANQRLNVLGTRETGGHPIFSNDENDMFRAVHDYYGHYQTGRGFDRHGEEAAYQAHARMYSPQARQALATETRGQNAALIRRGEFPEQKVALIGAEKLPAGGPRSPLLAQAQQFHTDQGLPPVMAQRFHREQGL